LNFSAAEQTNHRPEDIFYFWWVWLNKQRHMWMSDGEGWGGFNSMFATVPRW